MIKKIIRGIWKRKVLSGICLVVLAGTGYFGYQKISAKAGEIQYITSSAKKGTIIQSISGSGKVAASNQIDIKPGASGDVTWVYVKEGDNVKAGQLLFSIDPTDANQTVASAEIAYENAKIDLDNSLSPPDELTLLKAQTALDDAISGRQNAEDNLEKAYEDGLTAVTDIFFDLPDVMSDLDDILYNDDFKTSQWNIDWYKDAVSNYDSSATYYRNTAYNSYEKARANYDINFKDYKATSRYSDKEDIEALINETYETTKSIAEAVKDMNNLVDFVKDTLTKTESYIPTVVLTHQKTLQSYISSTNKLISQPLSAKRTIKDAKESISKADITIQEKQLALDDLKEGADDLTIRSKKLALQQKEASLNNAKQALYNCYARAPFDAIVADLSVTRGESVSSNTTAATLITTQKIAEITLNEIDVTNVKVGQKSTLTFDSVNNLSITGEVVMVDTLGTVSQNIVSYGVKIAFDLQDERIKPGMSVSVAIISDSKANILTIPLSALKTQSASSYVEIMKNGQPQQVNVEVGISNDTMVEILSGLQEGEEVVTQTINTNATSVSSGSGQSGTFNRNAGFGGTGTGQIMRMRR